MGAAFRERDTHVTAKCNVCFEGVNAAGSATEIQHAAAGGIANVRKGTAGVLRNDAVLLRITHCVRTVAS